MSGQIQRVWEKFQRKLAAENGLDVKNYPVKWRQSGELADKHNCLPIYSVRQRLFFELGGQSLENAIADDFNSSQASNKACVSLRG